jgi:hypothetical protein
MHLETVKQMLVTETEGGGTAVAPANIGTKAITLENSKGRPRRLITTHLTALAHTMLPNSTNF